MSYDVQSESSFTVAGISTRTSNSSAHEIGALWQQFYEIGAATKITSRIGDDIYSIYSEYESDHTGLFTVTIGYAVPAESDVPDGMVKKFVGAGSYAVFKAVGELPQSVIAAWASVWHTPLNRVYGADFERYRSHGEVTVHVGVR